MDRFSKKSSNIKFRENLSNGSGLVLFGRAVGRTDRRTDMTKLIVTFQNFANAPKMNDYHWDITYVALWNIRQIRSFRRKKVCFMVKKGKQSHYRPEVPIGFQEVKGPGLRDTGAMFYGTCIYFLDAFAKFRRPTTRFVIPVSLSVRPHGTTRLALDEF